LRNRLREGGTVVLSHNKKILISLPDNLVSEIDILATAGKTDRNKLLQEAAEGYVARQRSALIAEDLKKGYEEMADINIEIAEFCLEQDNIQQQHYEEKLAECE